MEAIICRSHGGLSANKKEEKFASNDNIVYPRSAKVLRDTPLEMLMCPKSNWNLEVLVFEQSKKLEYLEKNLLKQGQKQTTNSTHMSSMPRLEPGLYIDGRQLCTLDLLGSKP